MSDSVRPHGLQPTRLLRPWDSPGKNTGVGCHFLLQCMKVESESEIAQSRLTLSIPMDCSLPGSPIHGIFPGNSTGVGCHCLLPLFIIGDWNAKVGNQQILRVASRFGLGVQNEAGERLTQFCLLYKHYLSTI